VADYSCGASLNCCLKVMVHVFSFVVFQHLVPAVLRCGKQMEKLPHYNFLDSLSPKTEKLSLEETVDLSRDRLIT
jgi:hypothetical protein